MAKVENKIRNLQFWYPNIPRKLVMAKGLSIQAKYVYMYMSCQSETFDFLLEPMAEAMDIGQRTLSKYLDELIKAGWITKGKQKFKNGRLGAVDYTVETSPKKNKNENTDVQKSVCSKTDVSKCANKYNSTILNSPINEDNSTILNSPVNNEKDKIILSDDNKKSDDLFDLFWKKYKKGSKKAALKAWNKLKDKQKESALNNVDDYLIFCKRSGRPLKDVSTYLNGECFNDNWSAIPDCYQVGDFDDEQTKRFKQYMVKKFPDVVYHRNPLTYEQCYRLIEEYGADQFEEAMRKLCGRDIHQYYSVKIGVETILKEIQDDDI